MNIRIVILFILIGLSSLACVSALDLDSATDNLTNHDAHNIEAAVEPGNGEMLGKENDTVVMASESQASNLSSKDSTSSAYLVIDNDADKENIVIGDYVTWTISVLNRGPGNAKNVKVFDKLPDGLKYVTHKTTQGTFNPKTGIWNIGDILNGNEVFLYITTLAVSAGEKINKANLTSESVNLNNETYESEEIDVFDNPGREHAKHHADSMRPAGNPIGLILLSLLACFITYFKK
ncbi:DUF11 domain-containing protein [Methanobrevibacter sp.]|uniref:DUF11 domain-containing protein n=1 Tax=Methanobrevibacter sp. TaxID=66852 RepID=UPI0038664850